VTTIDPLKWLNLESGPGTPAHNMALDEALLEAMPRLGFPVLRSYSWTLPAASFGYFQKYSEVERLTQLRPLVRRPTGGGIVPHDADWTYSVVVPVCHPWYSLTAVESYRRVHEWICDAFALLGIKTELAPEPRHDTAGQCFIGYEQFDLLRRGRKIAGAAQRRRRDGLLIQGSVQAGAEAVPRRSWQQGLREAATSNWGISWNPFWLDEELSRRVETLEQKKYSQASYNQRR